MNCGQFLLAASRRVGCSGLLSLMVAKRHPHMTCVDFDLPEVIPIAQKTINHMSMGDRVKAVAGNFFHDRIPEADVVVMGNILHDWDEENKVTLMKNACAVLPKRGASVAIENVIEDDRRKNLMGMMMSLNMLIESGKGFDYTFSDFTRWATMAGFSSTRLLPLAGPSSAAIANK